MSKSMLFIRDGVVYLVSRGFAYMGQRQLDYGKPFLAAYRIHDGSQQYLHPFAIKEVVNGLHIEEETITLVFKNSIMKYSLLDGSLITGESYVSEEIGELRYFVGPQVYISSDSIYKSLTSTDTTKQFVFSSKGNVLILNDLLKIEGKISFEDLFLYYERHGDYLFIAKGDKTIILDKK